ncbi:MAG TPA: DUF4440 domain-containing protein [Blastocatellia bacterium]|jgi:uncharacterized protein (TIGR02246 family)|nr:DUF4440 domain-containing protein [Blastocatellia bacterium]
MAARFHHYSLRALLLVALIAISIITGCKPKTEQGDQQTSNSSGSSAKGGSSADMEAINKLNERDMQASKSLDVDALVSLWTDDIVSLAPGAEPVIGKEANRASLLELKKAMGDVEIPEYKFDFKEIKIAGDWAYEWGTFTGTAQAKGGKEPERQSGKVMRILRREPDGSWKIARTIYNIDSTDAEDDESAPQ